MITPKSQDALSLLQDFKIARLVKNGRLDESLFDDDIKKPIQAVQTLVRAIDWNNLNPDDNIVKRVFPYLVAIAHGSSAGENLFKDFDISERTVDDYIKERSYPNEHIVRPLIRQLKRIAETECLAFTPPTKKGTDRTNSLWPYAM